MKEMIYGPTRLFEVLDHGIYRNIPYWIVSRGTHPCCYLDISNYLSEREIKDIGEDGEDLEIDCHGGVSYAADHLDGVWDKNTEGFEPGKKTFVGWHYLHKGDYGGGEHFNEIMNEGISPFEWTTQELIHDTKRSIDTLFPYESKYNLKQMMYKGRGQIEVLGSGVLNGIPWWIVSYGSHPCAYIEVTGLSEAQIDAIGMFSHEYVSYDEDHLLFANWNSDNPDFTHGRRRFIGWDYGHIGDYTNDIPKPDIGASLFWSSLDIVPRPPEGASKEQLLEYYKKCRDADKSRRMYENSFVHEGHRWSSDEIYEEVKAAISEAMK